MAALVATDWLAMVASFGLAWAVRGLLWPALNPSYHGLYSFSTYLDDLYFLLPWTFAIGQAGLYTQRLLFWDEVRYTTRATTLATLFAIFLTFATKANTEVSRVLVVGAWIISLASLPAARAASKTLLVKSGWWGKRILILGAGEIGQLVLERVRQNRILGYEPVGFLDDDRRKHGSEIGGVRVLGPISTAPEHVRALGIRDVIIAMPRLPRPELLKVVAQCEGRVESIRIVPDMFGLATVGVETEDLDGMLLLHVRWNLAKPWNRVLKRTFDLAVATVTGIFLSPLLLLAALAVRVESVGPVFFVQERLGRNGRRFRCVKFRTMYMDAEARLAEHLHGNGAARREWEHFAKVKSDDPRVTRVGRILRRLSFDEWPQLYNVLRGEMSLVGPRPYLPAETMRMGAFAETILKAPPGITGLWQVSGRNELSFDHRLRLDEYYVRNWSLWMDVELLIKTARAVLRADGAY